jgi:hypothetical protein
MRLAFQSDLKQAARDVRALGRQAGFAQVVALTRTALDAKVAEQETMRSVFDRPTPYTINSVFVKPATKAKPEAQVGLKDEYGFPSENQITANRYLGPHIDAGPRSTKRFEKRLQLDGQMPRGWFAVPGQFARLDEYGNISRGQITQILSQLTLTKVSGYSAGITVRSRKGAIKRAGGEFIALPHGRGKLPPGIYQVTQFSAGRSAPRPVVIFFKSVANRRRFEFNGVAEQAADTFYTAHFEAALDQYAGGTQVN